MLDLSDQSMMKGIGKMAEDIGQLTVSIAEANGQIEDIDKRLAEERRVIDALEGAAGALSASSHDVARAAQSAEKATKRSEAQLLDGQGSVRRVLEQVTDLSSEVTDMAGAIDGLKEAFQLVSRVAQEISSIARMTNLLALNAQIEAARAGAAGRGFMVVAHEVKELSSKTSQATEQINETLGELGARTGMIVDANGRTLERAQSVRHETEKLGDLISQIAADGRDITAEQARIIGATADANAAIEQVEEIIENLGVMSRATEVNIRGSRKHMDSVVDASERLTAQASRFGVETVDTPFINAAQKIAKEISERFEHAVATGAISLHDLFDRKYTPIPGSNPEQVMTRFTQFTDRTLPDLQEDALTLSDRVVFCAAVDENGYLPTHNRKFSQPQRPTDPGWNAANCRNRRIFSDRVGLTAGQSKRPFVLQAYRRDMGNGSFVMMKDVSAPIVVMGRHWGGLRLAYRA
ncbi:MAG: hypothetical protein EBS68_04925 [Rhodobacteraceae bacterium]|nr:hypothetical protein [Paracoccaceae bacterium]